jgi:hypothetical protein
MLRWMSVIFKRSLHRCERQLQYGMLLKIERAAFAPPVLLQLAFRRGGMSGSSVSGVL